MCGRFGLYATSEELASETGSRRLGDFRIEKRYNIAPGQWIVIVRPEKNERIPSLARWGLVPSWTKDPEGGPKPINARAEGIVTKPTFRGALRHWRCLIPASGFYEWRKVGNTKVPHFIRPKGGGIFLFAGISDTWLGFDGELSTCAIVTTSANELMQPIHNRMPVILDRQAAEAWLDPENRHPEELLVPCPSEGIELRPVGSAVGNVRNDGPELIERARHELNAKRNWLQVVIDERAV
jgi:putative SOS response-associated peptidase YedK